MTLLAILTVLVIIVAISRYNESDNLFWKLFVSFVGGIAAATAAVSLVECSSNKQDKVVMIKQAPTQVLESMPCINCILADISLSATQGEKSPKPVSKDKMLNHNSGILSEVHTSPRGHPQFCMYYDDS